MVGSGRGGGYLLPPPRFQKLKDFEMEGARLLQVGSLGATPVNADVKSLGSDVAVKVLLNADYTMLGPPGFCFRPCFTGSDTPQYPHTIASGATLALLKAEADALVTAGGASYA